MFPLRHGALFVVFCAEPACFVKNVHLLYLAVSPHGAHGLKFIVLTQVQSGRVAASLHGMEKNVPKECCPNGSC